MERDLQVEPAISSAARTPASDFRRHTDNYRCTIGAQAKGQ